MMKSLMTYSSLSRRILIVFSLSHLIVDEAQDSNPLQFEFLLGYDCSGKLYVDG